MSSNILADNGVSSGTAGIKTTADNSGVLALQTTTSGGTATTAVTIDTSQNVGVGTSSPSTLLHVYGGNVTVEKASPLVELKDTTGGGNNYGIRSSGAKFLIRDTTSAADRLAIDTSGNLLVGATSAAGSEKLNVTTSANATIARFHNDAGSGSVNGLFVRYRNLTPNNTSNQFLYCDDFTALRMEVRSNGGIANYSANNANLSDERTKTDIQDAGGYLAKICAIPVRTFKYKDQTDDLLNLGVIAQEVEAVAPELVDTAGFGETPEDGVPLKAIYQTDLQYALMKCIQELNAKIIALENKQ